MCWIYLHYYDSPFPAMVLYSLSERSGYTVVVWLVHPQKSPLCTPDIPYSSLGKTTPAYMTFTALSHSCMSGTAMFLKKICSKSTVKSAVRLLHEALSQGGSSTINHTLQQRQILHSGVSAMSEQDVCNHALWAGQLKVGTAKGGSQQEQVHEKSWRTDRKRQKPAITSE